MHFVQQKGRQLQARIQEFSSGGPNFCFKNFDKPKKKKKEERKQKKKRICGGSFPSANCMI